MKIAICCSMKFKPLLIESMVKLKEIGITPLFPNLEENSKDIKTLASEQYRAVDESDAVYILTPNGYMGTSCKLELGYAIAKGKPIYFSEPTGDQSLDCYAKRFISHEYVKEFLS